jgi:hypothetical protein
MASQVPAGVPVDREQVDFLSSCSSLLVCHFFAPLCWRLLYRKKNKKKKNQFGRNNSGCAGVCYVLQIFGMAQQEMEYRVDLFNKWALFSDLLWPILLWFPLLVIDLFLLYVFSRVLGCWKAYCAASKETSKQAHIWANICSWQKQRLHYSSGLPRHALTSALKESECSYHTCCSLRASVFIIFFILRCILLETWYFLPSPMQL